MMVVEVQSLGKINKLLSASSFRFEKRQVGESLSKNHKQFYKKFSERQDKPLVVEISVQLWCLIALNYLYGSLIAVNGSQACNYRQVY